VEEAGIVIGLGMESEVRNFMTFHECVFKIYVSWESVTMVALGVFDLLGFFW
jgi:hypothetical protein